MTCPVCHQEIDPDSEVCPKCGTRLAPKVSEAQRKGGPRVTVILYVASVAIMAVFVALILGWREQQQRTLLLEQEAALEVETEEAPAVDLAVRELPEQSPAR